RDPSRRESVLDDAPLDGLDGDRIVVDAEDAGPLARGRAQRARELGEVVGGVQALDGLAPLVPIDEIVPVRDAVAERAALMTERDAAVHAAGALLLELRGGPREHDLLPVPQPFLDRPVRLLVPPELDEPRNLPHPSRHPRFRVAPSAPEDLRPTADD